jgi:eukaryotic-like serine/threonine-protein kinase
MSTLRAGSRLGPYEIISPLGAGGMGQVYRAHDPRLGRDVAIKVLPHELASDESALGRLRREAKTIAALSHPNILSLFDIGIEKDNWYLVTELLEGKTLREALGEGPMPESLIQEWGGVLAEAIGAAHGRGVIHRDLKPENIFITTEGRMTILDFGLARADIPAEDQAEIPTQSFFTEDGMVLGTVGYMSPEQIRAESAGPPSDVFSLGCVLYEMATGEPPFRRKTPVATLTAILHDEPPAIPNERNISPRLRAIISRCLEKNPAQRYRDGMELASALRQTATSPAGRRVTTAAGAAAAALLTALLVVVGVVSFVSNGDDASSGDEVSIVTSVPATVVALLPVATGDPVPPEYVAGAIEGEIERGLFGRRNLRILSPASTAELAKSERYRAWFEDRGVDFVLSTTVRGELSALEIQLDLESADGSSDSVSVQAVDLTSASSLVMAEIENLLDLAKSSATPASSVPRAMELYYQARYFWSRRGAEGVSRSIELFQKAIDQDPQFALAYVGLADAYSVLHNAAGLPASETFPRARAAAMKALQIDPTLPEAQISLGYLSHYYELDWERAETLYRRAIELRPDHATVHQWYAELLVVTGREDQARVEINRALELDPLSPIISATEIWLELMMRDYERAVHRGRSARAANPSDARAAAYIGRALVEMERLEEGEAMLRKAAEMEPSYIFDLWLAETLARRGKRTEAVKLLRSIESLDYINPYYHAFPYIALGDYPQALGLIEQAVETRVEQRAWMGTDPSLDPLRSREEFQSLLGRLRPAATR